jgi:hypothetical protein
MIGMKTHSHIGACDPASQGDKLICMLAGQAAGTSRCAMVNGGWHSHLKATPKIKTWMAGTGPVMTNCRFEQTRP